MVIQPGKDGCPEMKEFERFGWRGCWRCQHCLAVCPQGAVYIESIAFCCISTGEFHFPNDKAAEIAVGTVREHIGRPQCKMEVIFNVFKDSDYEIYRKLLGTDQRTEKGG